LTPEFIAGSQSFSLLGISFLPRPPSGQESFPITTSEPDPVRPRFLGRPTATRPTYFSYVPESDQVSDAQTHPRFNENGMAAGNIRAAQFGKMSDFNCYFFGAVCFDAFD
jgi:hypothetical protein